MAFYKLNKLLANVKNYGSKRSTSKIKYIVIHYTANDGDTDEANGKYFKNHVVLSSAHYFVDSDSVTQSVPDDYIAYSVGGKKYANCNKTGGGKYYGKCMNTNSINIELCDDKKDGAIYPSEKTIENAIALTKELMEKYNIPRSKVIRHFDVNGKSCPEYWCGTDSKNKKWKTEFWNKLDSESKNTSTVNTLSLNRNEKWKGVVTATKLNVRIWVGEKNAKCASLTKGTVLSVCDSKKDSNGTIWYYVKYGVNKYGFVHSNYIKKEVTKYTTTANLNLRSKAGVITEKNVLCVIPKGKVVEYKNKSKTVNGVAWYYVTYNKKTGYVSSKYLKKA